MESKFDKFWNQNFHIRSSGNPYLSIRWTGIENLRQNFCFIYSNVQSLHMFANYRWRKKQMKKMSRGFIQVSFNFHQPFHQVWSSPNITWTEFTMSMPHSTKDKSKKQNNRLQNFNSTTIPLSTNLILKSQQIS